VFRTVNDQPTLWDSILPPELLVLPVELGRVDALLDDRCSSRRSQRRVPHPSTLMEITTRCGDHAVAG